MLSPGPVEVRTQRVPLLSAWSRTPVGAASGFLLGLWLDNLSRFSSANHECSWKGRRTSEVTWTRT
jgi:hypothetical protein